jgi:hypothetical protein
MIENNGNPLKKHTYLTDKNHITWLFIMDGDILLAYSTIQEGHVELFRKAILTDVEEYCIMTS